jgi:Cytochrome bd terminal oxidase subunit I
MVLDVILLSRIQFALVVTCHIIFVTFAIGLAAARAVITYLAVLQRGHRGLAGRADRHRRGVLDLRRQGA